MSSHRGHHASAAGTSTAESRDWRARAACLGADPESFFPIGEPGKKMYQKSAATAKAMCAVCPVIAECLEDVLRTGDNFGIRGGLDPKERARQFPRPAARSSHVCTICGAALTGPRRKGAAQQRYCSDACRAVNKKQRQATYDKRKKAVKA